MAEVPVEWQEEQIAVPSHARLRPRAFVAPVLEVREVAVKSGETRWQRGASMTVASGLGARKPARRNDGLCSRIGSEHSVEALLAAHADVRPGDQWEVQVTPPLVDDLSITTRGTVTFEGWTRGPEGRLAHLAFAGTVDGTSTEYGGPVGIYARFVGDAWYDRRGNGLLSVVTLEGTAAKTVGNSKAVTCDLVAVGRAN